MPPPQRLLEPGVQVHSGDRRYPRLDHGSQPRLALRPDCTHGEHRTTGEPVERPYAACGRTTTRRRFAHYGARHARGRQLRGGRWSRSPGRVQDLS
jgi:hypothetical protein